MTPEEQIRLLQRRISNQRRELRRLNKYLGPYWAGFNRGLGMEGECRLRGAMNAAFGHERVHAVEHAMMEQRNIKAVLEPGAPTPPQKWFHRLRDALR
jgi:hypothetical protein